MLVMNVRDQRTWGLWRVRSPTSSNKMVANIRGRVEIKVNMKKGLECNQGKGEIRIRVKLG